MRGSKSKLQEKIPQQLLLIYHRKKKKKKKETRMDGRDRAIFYVENRRKRRGEMNRGSEHLRSWKRRKGWCKGEERGRGLGSPRNWDL